MSVSAGPPRTLTQMLREWGDDILARLFEARPDLAFPIPTDFSQVASRATTRQSVSDALDLLTSAELAMAIAAAAETTPFSGDHLVEQVTARHPDAADAAAGALRRVWLLGLLWGDWEHLRPVRALPGVLADSSAAPKSPWKAPSLDAVDTQSPALVDKVAAGSAFEFVRRMDVLVEHLDHHPVRLTRAGSFASRDVRSLALLLDASGTVTLASLELARAAGLIGLMAREQAEVLIPSREFEEWQRLSLAEQWGRLAETWLDRHPGTGSGRFKRMCLDVFGDPAEARVVTAKDLHTWLRWYRPRRPSNADRRATQLLDEAAALGMTGRGALASYAYPIAPGELAGLLPERVEHVLIQADLTAIAPGPLTPEAAQELGTLADVESRGGATVYRFSGTSLARAHSLGWTVTDIMATLLTRSRTPVPQPLEYLVRELDRPGRPASGSPGAPRQHVPPPRASASTDDEDLTPADRLDAAMVGRVIASLRSGESSEGADDEPVGVTAADHFSAPPVETLREATETQELVWLGFVDSRGSTSERVVRVLSSDEGIVVAEDTHGARLELPIHRVSAAHIIRSRS